MLKTTKKEVALFLKEKYGISLEMANEVCGAFLESVMQLATSENGVLLKNFGKLKVEKKRVVKSVNNFKTNEKQLKEIEKTVLKFIPSKNLKSRIF